MWVHGLWGSVGPRVCGHWEDSGDLRGSCSGERRMRREEGALGQEVWRQMGPELRAGAGRGAGLWTTLFP